MLSRLTRRTPLVTKDQIHQGPMFTPGERNVRVAVAVNAQESPDQFRDGSTPARPAMAQVVVFSYGNSDYISDQRFQAPNLVHDPRSQGVIRGRQTPSTLRQNIAVPAHVAYGSMLAMNYEPNPYWR